MKKYLNRFLEYIKFKWWCLFYNKYYNAAICIYTPKKAYDKYLFDKNIIEKSVKSISENHKKYDDFSHSNGFVGCIREDWLDVINKKIQEKENEKN